MTEVMRICLGMRQDRSMSCSATMAWDTPNVVEGFVRSPANQTLLQYAGRLRQVDSPVQVLDIGCGAGRNAVPLARAGFLVRGVDLSWPMIQAVSARNAAGRLQLAVATMDALPIADRSIDLIIAHGIWNLARSRDEFRRGLREAARVANPRARLFVFTFSRQTLPVFEQPVNGETFVYTRFSGEPQVFLTREQLINELSSVGFEPDPILPLRELNVPPPGQQRLGGPPIIFEGGFIYSGK
jgi:SAM-dependent methyltransferase